ncbi:MAG: hypothetical protein R2873_25715 [Caldilineaceae bacterium]|nr:hypothetical protein [Caldilineaceae bacterium]
MTGQPTFISPLRKDQDHRHLRLSAWQKSLLLVFVGLFAFVFPFLCWGAMADPSHPHAHAHLVFADPPSQSEQLGVVFDPVHGHFHTNTTCGDACDAAGQSNLDTLLVMLLIVLFFAWRYGLHLPTQTSVAHRLLGHPRHAPLIPTPPPRAV